MNKDATADATPARVSKASPIDSPREKYTVFSGSLAKIVLELEGIAADVILFGSGGWGDGHEINDSSFQCIYNTLELQRLDPSMQVSNKSE